MSRFLEKRKLNQATLIGAMRNKAAVSTIALFATAGFIAPAYATIDNTVTVNALDPDGNPVLDGGNPPTASETVDVVDEVVTMDVDKTITSSTPVAGGYGPGDTINYQIVIRNTGNVTLTAVNVSETFEGVGGVTLPEPVLSNSSGTSSDTTGDTIVDNIGPGDTATYTFSYVVQVGDMLDANNGGDSDIDNSVSATAISKNGTTATAATGDSLSASAAAPLFIDPDLSITKFAVSVLNSDDTTRLAIYDTATDPANPALISATTPDDAEAIVGEKIVYYYVVTNTGNVPLSDVSLSDDLTIGTSTGTTTSTVTPTFTSFHVNTGSTNADANNDEIETLGVGDVAIFGFTYTVTQDDVDQLQ